MYAVICTDGKVSLMRNITTGKAQMRRVTVFVRLRTVLSNTPGISIIQLCVCMCVVAASVLTEICQYVGVGSHREQYF